MTTKITDVLIWSRSKFVHVHCKVLRRWLQRWPAWHQKLPPGIRLGNLAKSWPGVSTRLSIGWTGHMESTIGIEADCGHNGNLDMKKVLRDDVGQIRSNDDRSTKWYRFPSGYYLGGVTSKSSDWSENQMVSILVSKGYVTDNQGRERKCWAHYSATRRRFCKTRDPKKIFRAALLDKHICLHWKTSFVAAAMYISPPSQRGHCSSSEKQIPTPPEISAFFCWNNFPPWEMNKVQLLRGER